MRKFALKNDDKPHRCPAVVENNCSGSFSPITSDLAHKYGVPYWIIYLLPFKCTECGVRTLPHIGIRLFFYRLKKKLRVW